MMLRSLLGLVLSVSFLVANGSATAGEAAMGTSLYPAKVLKGQEAIFFQGTNKGDFSFWLHGKQVGSPSFIPSQTLSESMVIFQSFSDGTKIARILTPSVEGEFEYQVAHSFLLDDENHILGIARGEARDYCSNHEEENICAREIDFELVDVDGDEKRGGGHEIKRMVYLVARGEDRHADGTHTFHNFDVTGFENMGLEEALREVIFGGAKTAGTKLSYDQALNFQILLDEGILLTDNKDGSGHNIDQQP